MGMVSIQCIRSKSITHALDGLRVTTVEGERLFGLESLTEAHEPHGSLLLLALPASSSQFKCFHCEDRLSAILLQVEVTSMAV